MNILNNLTIEVNFSITREEQRDSRAEKILSGSSLTIVVAVACLQRKASSHPENKGRNVLPFFVKKKKGAGEG